MFSSSAHSLARNEHSFFTEYSVSGIVIEKAAPDSLPRRDANVGIGSLAEGCGRGHAVRGAGEKCFPVIQ